MPPKTKKDKANEAEVSEPNTRRSKRTRDVPPRYRKDDEKIVTKAKKTTEKLTTKPQKTVTTPDMIIPETSSINQKDGPIIISEGGPDAQGSPKGDGFIDPEQGSSRKPDGVSLDPKEGGSKDTGSGSKDSSPDTHLPNKKESKRIAESSSSSSSSDSDNR